MGKINKVLTVTVASIFLYAVWAFYSGFDEVYAGLQRVGWVGFGLLLVLSLFNYGLRFFRWHLMIGQVTGVWVPLRAHLSCYLSGFALTATPGKVGEALRSYYLRPHGVAVKDSLAALFAERLIDLISVLFIGALALTRFAEYRWIGIAVIVVVLLAAGCVRSPYLVIFLRWLQAKINNQKLHYTLSHLIDMMESAARYMVWRVWLIGLILGVIAWGAEAWGLMLLVTWLTGEDATLIVAGIYALSMIVGAISFLPGGLGGAEAVMAGLLVALGVSFSDATVATIICRVVTLWFAIFIGLAVMMRYQYIAAQKLKLSSEETL
ncbi:lysylphosphatidylglycerol synthase transmembrane domain-containing protein [Teredinibacter waterburyi]|uniref:lysylphosphatidylglycerol synthase transmembrane domain-containing protein n=1 Tax=Teredinibacter waterburyi TaxID=1500538 RepID=UPI00165F58FD|nr:lysylphosphatidylglycerol synthase transmembrane domain-containing protein [Teredinibacter waterburyi]